MSQGASGSTKLMLIVWVLAMLFIGFKALNAPSSDSSHSETMVENTVLERIKPVGEVRVDTSTQVASAESVETANAQEKRFTAVNALAAIHLELWAHLSTHL